MPRPSPKRDGLANPRIERSFASKRTSVRENGVIMLRAHALWPMKTAQHVAAITGYSTRAVENWDAERARIPADALTALLRSEWGREFLAAVMADAEPRWWVRLKAFFHALDVVAMQRVTRRKLKEALDAEQAARQAASPSYAQGLSDEAFYSGQPSPFPAVARKRGR